MGTWEEAQPEQQVEAAAAAAQTHSARLQQPDLAASELADDDVPPPAYGDVYGELRNEKDGLGTSASVTDDGRVNIRINQLNRRLSQVFTPALRQHVQSAQDTRPPPPPYIPPSLGGEEGVAPPPPLNVVIQVVGSRGDVQPFVALGKVLKDTYGHRVRLATHPIFKDFVQDNDLEFFSIDGDPSRLMAFMVKNPGLMPGFQSLMGGDVKQRRRDVAEYIQGCWRSCYKAGDGMSLGAADGDPSERPFVADCIIANPPSFAHIHCAEKLGIPLHIMFTMPYSPTQAFPHPLTNIQSSNADPQLTNYLSYAMIEVLSWQGLGDIINRFRAKCLGLDPVSLFWGPGMLQRLKIPHTYCWSPALIPKPKDWGAQISVAGFYFLNLASNYIPSPDLQAFLDAGPPPVYIGFGSIVVDSPNLLTERIFEAARKTGQRVLLSKGWGGMGADELGIPDGVFMLGNVPHDWLFKRVSCLVHHGGAGTTAAGISAGRPTVVVPFFGDQPFWGAMVARAGAGPDPIPYKQLTVDKLADAINFCLRPESLERAKELANKIAEERGSDVGAQSFHQYLEPDRLRCTIAPSRSAAWRIKRTQIKLSAFAACTLANANLLDFHDLKLFRPQEHYTDEGPWDPVSGGFMAACGTFSSMAMGIADFPSETYKALHVPSWPSRQQSQASTSTLARKSKSGSTPPTSAEQSQTSLNLQESLASARNPPSSSTSNMRSSSISDLKQDDASRSQIRDQFGSGQDRDRLRQTGVHTNKGLGRIVKSLVQAPMDVSVSLTQGFHNLPKLWGDDTVRPQERVSDFKSGVKAVGKEFGYGWYDGVTGLVTQPWKGAQKEGVTGFIKGVGKGVGGFAAKPGAALFGILSHPMKGVHKEMQKLFSGNVQNYIVASRTAQGYEEWLRSSDAEKQDVVDRWNLIQEYLKKRNHDELVRDALEAQQKTNRGYPTRPAWSVNSADAAAHDAESDTLAMGDSQSPLRPSGPDPAEQLEAAEINETIRRLFQESLGVDGGESPGVAQENDSPLQSQRQEGADHLSDEENLRRAMASSEAEARKYASEALEYDKQLKLALARSLQRQKSSDSEWGSDVSLDEEEDAMFADAKGQSERMAEKAAAVASGSLDSQQPPSYDQGHLEGTTKTEFEAQRRVQQGEKSTQEKTEEEIVMEYVKKQSLLEAHHQNKGKGRASAAEDHDDDDLQQALKLSMQGHERNAEHGNGEASGV